MDGIHCVCVCVSVSEARAVCSVTGGHRSRGERESFHCLPSQGQMAPPEYLITSSVLFPLGSAAHVIRAGALITRYTLGRHVVQEVERVSW